MEERIRSYNTRFRKAGAEKILEYFLSEYSGKIVFSTSLGAEDQVLIHMIASMDPAARIITLDTGRLFPETYELLEKTRERYGISIEVFFPDYLQVEQMVRDKGVNLFYRSIENRKLCCQIRKVEPVKRALKGMEAWISGLRREQSISRISTLPVEWDEQYHLLKISPLFDWTDRQVWEYIRNNDIPYNVLHDKSFPSIGCQPCTRAIRPGEDPRAGRWWWEQPEQRECGLHDSK
jgi:phosphoadenosine phosphosulfate reductase